MATAAQLARLDEAHRRRQSSSAGALVKALYETWQQVQPTALAQTGTTWLAAAIALIVGRRHLSSLYALDYARQIRQLQFGPAGLDDAPATLLQDFPTLIREWEGVLDGQGFVSPLDVPDLPGVPAANLEQIRESLIHVALRQTAMRQVTIPDKRSPAPLSLISDPDERDRIARENETILRENAAIDEMVAELMPAAQQRAGAAAVRHVQRGGRDAVDAVVAQDLKARGYIRITRPGCCFFCAMLASRGPVYKEDSFAESDPRFTGPGDHKAHDDCGCALRPVYTRDGSEWTTVARESSDIWEEIRKEKGRVPRLNEFRERWDARNESLRASMQ